MVNKKGEILNAKLKEALLEHKNVGEIRNIGMINAIELVTDKETKETFDSKDRIGYQIYKKALDNGLLLRPLGNILYFNPPYVINEEDMDFMIKQTKKSLIEILGE